MAKSSNKILFAEIPNAKNQSRSIGMRHLTTSTEFKQSLFPFFYSIFAAIPQTRINTTDLNNLE